MEVPPDYREDSCGAGDFASGELLGSCRVMSSQTSHARLAVVIIQQSDDLAGHLSGFATRHADMDIHLPAGGGEKDVLAPQFRDRSIKERNNVGAVVRGHFSLIPMSSDRPASSCCLPSVFTKMRNAGLTL